MASISSIIINQIVNSKLFGKSVGLDPFIAINVLETLTEIIKIDEKIQNRKANHKTEDIEMLKYITE